MLLLFFIILIEENEQLTSEKKLADNIFYSSKPRGFTKKPSVDSVCLRAPDSNYDSLERFSKEEGKVKELREEEEDEAEKLADISFSKGFILFFFSFFLKEETGYFLSNLYLNIL